MLVFISGLIGSELAPVEHLATLPMTFVVLGLALSTIPAALVMRKVGRKRGMQIGIFVAICSAVVGFLALYHSHFYWFLLASLGFGFNTAFVQQSRFVILENAENQAQQADGLTLALMANLVGAFLGPQMGEWGSTLLQGHGSFTGAFILLASVLLLALAILSLFYKEISSSNEEEQEHRTHSPTWHILKQPMFIIAAGSTAISYAIMSLIMTSTPISMHEMDGHSLVHTKWVIQSHIIAMFLPSLLSGQLLKRGYRASLLLAGLACYLIVSLIALKGAEFMHYWLALVILGLGWNFLFMTSTTILPSTYAENDRHKAQAINDFSAFSIQGIATFSAGWLLFSIGWSGILSLSIMITIAWGCAIVYLLKKARPKASSN
jgi:MFS family permease